MSDSDPIPFDRDKKPRPPFISYTGNPESADYLDWYDQLEPAAKVEQFKQPKENP